MKVMRKKVITALLTVTPRKLPTSAILFFFGSQVSLPGNRLVPVVSVTWRHPRRASMTWALKLRTIQKSWRKNAAADMVNPNTKEM